MSTVNSNSIFLILGDIIKINSPTNSTYHEKTFIIDYIDSHYMKIKNSEMEDILTFNDNQKLNDTSITKIKLLKRQEQIGFARQNNLIPGTWINVYFSGNIPICITGFIQTIEEDMIEIKLYPDDSYIYIDFAYKGIPNDKNIETIEIRDSPEESDNTNDKCINKTKNNEDDIENDKDDIEENDKGVTEEKDEVDVEKKEDEDIEYDMDNTDPNTPQGTPPAIQIQRYEEENKIREDQIVEEVEEDENLNMEDDEDDDGSDLGEIMQYVKVGDDELRYGLQIQLDDLSNAILSKKETKKNKSLFNEIDKIIHRFTMLREEFSKKDHNDYPVEPLFLGIDNKPLVNIMSNFKNNLPWIIPTMKCKHKIYDVPFNENNHPDAEYVEFLDERAFELEQMKKYNSYSNEMYIEKANSTFSPYIEDESFQTIRPLTPINSISHNIKIYDSSRVYNDNIVLNSNVNNRILETDNIHFNGYICIFDYLLEASRAHLNDTNILEKSTLLLPNFKNYSSIYRNTKLNSYLFDENENDNYKFKFNNMNHVYHNENISWYDFLNKTLPSNKDVIQEYQNKIMEENNAISLDSLLKPLSSFYINTSTIVYEDYETIVSKIYDKRRSFYKNTNEYVKKNKKVYDSFKNIQKKNINFTEKGQIISNFENYFRGKSKEEKSTLVEFIFNIYYQNTELKFNTQHERLLYYLTQDNISCFTSILNFSNIHLLNPDIEGMLVKYQEKNTSEKKDTSICSENIQIAKKYIAKDEMEDDNNKVIYYDKQYDKTYYTALEIYDKERKTMTPEQFQTYLESKIKEVHELSEEESIEMVKNILNGKKKVQNGDFCILETVSEESELIDLKFYKRINNNWTYDEEINKKYKNNFDLNFNTGICTTKLPCFEIDNSYTDMCNDSNDKKKQLQSKFINEMMNEYKHIQSKTKNEYKFIIEKCELQLKYKRTISEKYLYKYSEYNNRLAEEYEENPNLIVSPHVKLRDQIFNIKNFETLHEELNLFIKTYCRNPYKELKEDIYWLYCKESQVPLLPIFWHRLNQAYVKNENYLYTLEKICQKQGRLSDDESKWTDVHSGWTIRNIDFFTEEGFDEFGRKQNTRDVIEDNQDIEQEETVEESQILNDYKHEYTNDKENDQKFTETTTVENENELSFEDTISNNELSKTYSNPDIQFIDTLFGIMENKLAISKNTNLKHKILTQLVLFYDKEKKKNKINTYKLILLFTSSFIVYLQMRIKEIMINIKVTKCKPFLKGFPVHEPNDNLETVKYVCCLVLNFKLNDSLLSKKESDLMNDVVALLNYLQINEFQTIISNYKKNETNTSDSMYKLYTWNNFVPPLFDFTIKRLQPIQKNLPYSMEYFNIIISKLYSYSYAFIDKIQQVTSKQNFLLKTGNQEPYLENTCCLKVFNPNDFFINEDKDIINILKHLDELFVVYKEIKKINNVNNFSFKDNTKNVFPSIDENLSDNTLDIIKVYLKDENVDELNIDNISNVLMSYYKKNKIDYNETKFIDIYEPIMNILINNSKNENVDNDIYKLNKFEKIYGDIIANYDDSKKNVDNDEIISFKAFLFENIEINSKKILEWLNILQLPNFQKHPVFDMIHSFQVNSETKYSYYEMIKIIELMKSFTFQFCNLIPSMLINKLKVNKIDIPKHWQLAPSHILNLQEYMIKYYDNFSYFIDNEELIISLEKYVNSNNDLITLFNHIKILPDKSNYTTNILIYTYFFYVFILKFIDTIENVPKQLIDKYLNNVFVSFYQQKITTMTSYDQIMKQILKSKQDEKDKIVKKLKRKSKEERKVINELKKYKLGEWGKGLSKGLVTYDENVFTEEQNLFMDDEDRENNDLTYYDGNDNTIEVD